MKFGHLMCALLMTVATLSCKMNSGGLTQSSDPQTSDISEPSSKDSEAISSQSPSNGLGSQANESVSVLDGNGKLALASSSQFCSNSSTSTCVNKDEGAGCDTNGVVGRCVFRDGNQCSCIPANQPVYSSTVCNGSTGGSRDTCANMNNGSLCDASSTVGACVFFDSSSRCTCRSAPKFAVSFHGTCGSFGSSSCRNKSAGTACVAPGSFIGVCTPSSELNSSCSCLKNEASTTPIFNGTCDGFGPTSCTNRASGSICALTGSETGFGRCLFNSESSSSCGCYQVASNSSSTGANFSVVGSIARADVFLSSGNTEASVRPRVTKALNAPRPEEVINPSNLKFSSSVYYEAKIEWTASPFASSYLIAYSQGSTPPTSCQTGSEVTTLTATLSNLRPSTSYAVRVCAVELGVKSLGTTIIGQTAVLTPPPTPINGIIDVWGPDRAFFKWTATQRPDLSGYVWAIGTSSNPPTSCTSGGLKSNIKIPRDTQLFINNLAPSTTYQFLICAQNSFDASSSPLTASFTTRAPGTPSKELIPCSSSAGQQNDCFIAAAQSILSAAVYEQQSSAACTFGNSYSFINTPASSTVPPHIRVSRGCRAIFLVEYQPKNSSTDDLIKKAWQDLEQTSFRTNADLSWANNFLASGKTIYDYRFLLASESPFENAIRQIWRQKNQLNSRGQADLEWARTWISDNRSIQQYRALLDGPGTPPLNQSQLELQVRDVWSDFEQTSFRTQSDLDWATKNFLTGGKTILDYRTLLAKESPVENSIREIWRLNGQTQTRTQADLTFAINYLINGASLQDYRNFVRQ